MPNPYPHLLPQDAQVWKDFLGSHPTDYTHIDYDVRVGLGRDPGQNYPSNIRQMALDLSMRRIDCVGFKPTTIDVIEVTFSAGLKAIGQLHAYPVLYKLTFVPSMPVNTLLVCHEIQSDVIHVIESLQIPYFIV